jgi:acyl-CoA synthetase (NDP forming)
MNYSKLDPLFHPRSIAVVGASSDFAGSLQMSIFIEYGFQGDVYPVNINGSEVLGHKVYRSIKDIPGPVDYAFVQVPAKVAVQAVRDCAAKGVKLVSMFTAGFTESENEGVAELEHELERVVRQGGFRLLGPNCMGVYCPDAYLSWVLDFPRKSGPVGALCQSGGNANQLVRAGRHQGICFSKVISYGNALDINEGDLLEYFAADEKTKIVIAYIEGVKEGRRFFDVLKKAAQAKPVIILKGGQTKAGAIAAQSHTGSMAGSREVWSSLIRQAGAIESQSIEECIDIAIALLLIKPPRSRKTAVIGYGGGAAVRAADECSISGLVLPPIPQEIRSQLKKFIPVAGNIFRNPVDMGGIVANTARIGDTVKLVAGWTGVDILILHMAIDLAVYDLVKGNLFEPMGKAFIDAAQGIAKPTVLAIDAVYSSSSYQGYDSVQRMCHEAGLPCYPSIQRAANALDKIMRYYSSKVNYES